MYREINNQYVDVVFETNSEFSEWFGYYNYDVLSRDATKMLCNRVNFDARAITKDDTADLGWYDLRTGQWNYIDTTDSFNWQQGAMLQWLPGDGNENKVIYNQSDKIHFHSVIYDIKNGEKKIINFPIYAVTPDGRYGVALNYERCYWCRAYHYMPIANEKYNVRLPEDDGIFLVDLQKNTAKRLISIQDIVSVDPLSDYDKAWHWAEHIMLNRSGLQIAFLHRYSYENVNNYKTRVMVANIDGSNLQVLTDWRTNQFTHLGWGENSFVVYSRTQSALESSYTLQAQKKTSAASPLTWMKKIVRNLVPKSVKEGLKKNETGYRFYELVDGRYQYKRSYFCDMFKIDGHPSITHDSKYIVTDTYPDPNDNHNLVVYNMETGKNLCLATLSATLMGNPASCDLHPKLCHGDEYAVVDTAYTGKHKMIIMKIKWNEIRKQLD